MAELWRRCSACKAPIELGGVHWVCSVSTCNRKRTGLVFCSVDCWEIHLPTERHREAWAVEARAPLQPESETSKAVEASPRGAESARPRETKRRAASGSEPARKRTVIRRRGASSPASNATPTAATRAGVDEEILVVASRLKQYIREVSGFSTSDGVLPILSDALRRICDEAIRNARAAERLTVMDRDVPRG